MRGNRMRRGESRGALLAHSEKYDERKQAMGNRAVITTEDRKMGVYLQWNGGRDSVEPFLEYCRLKGYACPSRDMDYGYARLAQVVGNFFGGVGCVGVVLYDAPDREMNPGDNGIYVIEDWKIKERILPDGFRGEQREFDPREMLVAINRAQPAAEQIPEDFFSSQVVDAAELSIGDEVWFLDPIGIYRNYEIVGRGEPGKRVNGRMMEGVPYVNRYEQPHPEENCNNYLTEESYRVFRRADAIAE